MMVQSAGAVRITAVDIASSSSDLAWEAAADGAPSGSGFLVGEQTAGRGRRGAGWSSARGGMYFSLLLRPNLASADLFGLSFIASLAIREELARRIDGHKIAVKWPNDVLANGGKICGILLEARDHAVVIGTGVNIAAVNTAPGSKLPAISMHDLGSVTTTPDLLASAYAANLMARLDDYERDGFAPIREEWLSHCGHLDATLKVGQGDSIISGRFADLGHDGTMHLEDEQGRRHTITTGDVELMGTV